jgi:hypothetical protein
METARDVILVICAVISAACLLYIAYNLDTTPADETDEPAARVGLNFQDRSGSQESGS